MKKKFKRIFSVLLAVLTVFSAIAVFGTSTYGAESETTPVVSGDAVADTVEASTVPEETTEPSIAVTEPTAVNPTEPPSVIVGNVKNIVKTSFLTDKITLKWDKVSGAITPENIEQALLECEI